MSTRRISVEIPSTLTSATLRDAARRARNQDLGWLYAEAARQVARCEYLDELELRWLRRAASGQLDDLPRGWQARARVFWRDSYPLDELMRLVDQHAAELGGRLTFDAFHRAALKDNRERRHAAAPPTIRAVEDHT